MKDLRKTQDVNSGSEIPTNFNFNFNPFKWVRNNWINIVFLLSLFILMNLLFNPAGVSKFISGWLTDFLSNWNV